MNQYVAVGNLTKDPVPNKDNSGVSFTIATNRRYTTKGGEQVVETIFMDCIAWRGLGAHVLASLHKGDRVVGQGHLEQSTYTTDGPQGEKVERTRIRCVLNSIGPDLRFATAQVTRIGITAPSVSALDGDPVEVPVG
jgi:single-strand DNA-binding protein